MITLDTLPDNIIEKISENLDNIHLYNFSEVFRFLKVIYYYKNYWNNLDDSEWNDIFFQIFDENIEKLNYTFIREFQDKVDWDDMLFFVHMGEKMPLSEDFIREFQDKVDWEDISHKQKIK